MKSLQRLAQVMLKDLGMICCVDTARDFKTVASRIEHEGDQFLTITLPSFGKDFERSLDQGKVGDDLFLSFKRRGGLPVFLRGFLLQVFDPSGSSLLVEPSVEAIYAVRQFTLAFGKIFELPTPRRERDAMRNFTQTEEEIKTHERTLQDLLHEGPSSQQVTPSAEGDLLVRCARPVANHTFLGGRDGSRVPDLGDSLDHAANARGRRATLTGRDVRTLHEYSRACVSLFGGALSRIDTDLWSSHVPEDIVGQHGPGATADRRRGNQKFAYPSWPDRLEREFPFLEWMLPNHRSVYLDELDRVTFLTPEQEIPVKVVSVPKTAKTPRIIAEEPTAMQFAQQALGKTLVQKLESDRLLRWMIGFTDQEPNRLLAMKGSLKGDLATLDLSEASDRVLNLHVVNLLARWPSLSSAVQACRSTKADVLGHGVIPLAKFASMGSGLTFPIESMVFLAIVVTSIALAQDELPTRRFIRTLAGRVRVYGDDIIVPSDYAEYVVAGLETFGLKVNRNKSFWTGLFRESCGGDYYAGEPVTPVRVRKRFPSTRRDAEEIASLVSLRNQFYEAGLWTTARWLDSQIAEVLPHFPIVEPTSSLLGRRSVCFRPSAGGWDDDRHVPLVKGYVQVARPPVNKLDGVPALVKWFLHRAANPQGDPLEEDHLLRSGRAESTYLKLGWRCPF